MFKVLDSIKCKLATILMPDNFNVIYAAIAVGFVVGFSVFIYAVRYSDPDIADLFGVFGGFAAYMISFTLTLGVYNFFDKGIPAILEKFKK